MGKKNREKILILWVNQEIFMKKTNARFPEIAGIFDVTEDILLRANTLRL
jgi:hypothetical protein